MSEIVAWVGIMLSTYLTIRCRHASAGIAAVVLWLAGCTAAALAGGQSTGASPSLSVWVIFGWIACTAYCALIRALAGIANQIAACRQSNRRMRPRGSAAVRLTEASRPALRDL